MSSGFGIIAKLLTDGFALMQVVMCALHDGCFVHFLDKSRLLILILMPLNFDMRGVVQPPLVCNL